MLGWRIANTASKITALVRKIRTFGDRAVVCYEAGPTGYGLARRLDREPWMRCLVIAPSLIPVKAGDRIKTDRRDAAKLADFLRADS